MGGTFNPPHFGHFSIAQQSIAQLGLSKVLFIPTGRITYKEADDIVSGRDRYNMLKLVVDENRDFELSDIEISDSGVTYTVNTLERLKNGSCSGWELYFLVGADSLDYMEKWREPQRIFGLCTVAVVGRAQIPERQLCEKIKNLKQQYDAEIVRVEMPIVDVSSTLLRSNIKQNKPIRYMTDDKIIEYINNHSLYK
ncbi:MAG TPA: nicotinate-nucleotide adenylyltransferase [Candidatus Monoglobus merdigallinarum]|uniref:Probable nicotinate-nucleotide adenylyltransferase n=1 Tax=Candidatus Monoglobus merdigallinarum TaxID=2838698 RepID=A0A9D1PRN9_9FIRM|nr:nicotinate-nucleotide adenylyltransferase [Candidatus Monoglobus merdigallinarum]